MVLATLAALLRTAANRVQPLESVQITLPRVAITQRVTRQLILVHLLPLPLLFSIVRLLKETINREHFIQKGLHLTFHMLLFDSFLLGHFIVVFVNK